MYHNLPADSWENQALNHTPYPPQSLPVNNFSQAPAASSSNISANYNYLSTGLDGHDLLDPAYLLPVEPAVSASYVEPVVNTGHTFSGSPNQTNVHSLPSLTQNGPVNSLPFPLSSPSLVPAFPTPSRALVRHHTLARIPSPNPQAPLPEARLEHASARENQPHSEGRTILRRHSARVSPAPPREANFPQKLWAAADDPKLLFIMWCGDGERICFTESNKYVEANLMKKNNIQSFIRQLNSYGFSKLPDQSGATIDTIFYPYCFVHPNFKKSHPELLRHVNRKEGARTIAHRANRLHLNLPLTPPLLRDDASNPRSSGSSNGAAGTTPITPLTQFQHNEIYIQQSPAFPPGFPDPVESNNPYATLHQTSPSVITNEMVYKFMLDEQARHDGALKQLTGRLDDLEARIQQHFSLQPGGVISSLDEFRATLDGYEGHAF